MLSIVNHSVVARKMIFIWSVYQINSDKFAYSKLTIETLEQGVKYVQS